MKKLIVFAVLAITLFSCDKQASNKLASEEMNAEELKAKYGIVIPEFEYDGEPATLRNNNQSRGKKKASEQILVVWFNDLVISGSVTCTVSPNAEWGGIQRYLAEPLSIDGAVSHCNFYWYENETPQPMNCPTSTAGVYRGWTSDHDYNIHISNNLTIP